MKNNNRTKREPKNIRNKRKKLVSVVIPSFKDEKYIRSTIAEVKEVLDKSIYDYEILVVVDGMVDDTKKIVSEMTKKSRKLKLFAYKTNRGKGYAVRLGFAKAKGDFIGFIDSDGQIAASAITDALAKLSSTKCDIVVGSKKHAGSKVIYSKSRKLISKLSQFFIKSMFNIGVSDTQAGLKFFKKSIIKKITPLLVVDRFAMDIEILSLARHLGYEQVEEVPISVKSVDDNGKKIIQTISMSDLLETFRDSLLVFYRLKINKNSDFLK